MTAEEYARAAEWLTSNDLAKFINLQIDPLRLTRIIVRPIYAEAGDDQVRGIDSSVHVVVSKHPRWREHWRTGSRVTLPIVISDKLIEDIDACGHFLIGAISRQVVSLLFSEALKHGR